MEVQEFKHDFSPVVKELPEDLQGQVVSKFEQFAVDAAVWKEKVKGLVVTDVSQTDLMDQARTARLELRKIRTGADKIRKALKEDATKYNKAVQGVYNLIEQAIKPLEEHLLEQEEYAKRIEEERKAEIREERAKIASDYYQFVPANTDWAEMTQEDFDRQIENAKKLKELEEKEMRERVEERKRQELIIARQKEIMPLMRHIPEHEYDGQDSDVERYTEEEWRALVDPLKEMAARKPAPLPKRTESTGQSSKSQLEKLQGLISEAGAFAKECEQFFPKEEKKSLYEPLITGLRTALISVNSKLQSND